MKISYKLLKNWINLTEGPRDIADLINLHITEVENVASSSRYQGVVVGEIVEITSHPHADKLQLTKVDVGGGQVLDIVCGADNIAVGQKVPVALVGCTLPSGLAINTATIRGQRSFGMLCSRAELKLGDDTSSIWILDSALTVGTPLSEVIGEDSDTIFDIKVLANRPDYLSYLSVAREVAAVLKKGFSPPIKYDFTEVSGSTDPVVAVDVKDNQLCPRYIGRVIKDLTIKPSPDWIQQVLMAAGLRPINNIVDISNYVMLELGQPVHAFDLEKIVGQQIVVRRAKAGESLMALDGHKYELDQETLVIADDKKPLAIAGIVGDEASSVTLTTRDILLEVANFDMVSIRKTSRRLGVRTESSTRFERGLSALLSESAMQRLVHLIQQDCPACQVLKRMIDVYDELPPVKTELAVGADRVNRLIGLEIEPHTMADILTRLDMPTDLAGDKLAVQVPNYRADIIGVDDIAEEVLRIYGTDKVATAMPSITVSLSRLEPSRLFVRRMREIMARLGFEEVYLPPFDQGSPNAIKLDNPLVSHLTHLKTDLASGLMKAEITDSSERADVFGIFEIGAVFSETSDILPKETTQLAGRLGGIEAYRQARGVLDVITRELGVCADYHEVKGVAGLRILINKQPVGEVVQVSPVSAYLTLDLDILANCAKPIKPLQLLPKFPPVKFDMAFIVPHRVRVGELLASAASADILIRRVDLFDVYDLGDAGKNVAFHVELRSETKTLTSQDRKRAEDEIKNVLQERYKAKLRED